MTVPDFQSYMSPTLLLTENGNKNSMITIMV
jgi:hypothetical protein